MKIHYFFPFTLCSERHSFAGALSQVEQKYLIHGFSPWWEQQFSTSNIGPIRDTGEIQRHLWLSWPERTWVQGRAWMLSGLPRHRASARPKVNNAGQKLTVQDSVRVNIQQPLKTPISILPSARRTLPRDSASQPGLGKLEWPLQEPGKTVG